MKAAVFGGGRVATASGFRRVDAAGSAGTRPNCHVFPSWLDALEHCRRTLRACRKSISLDPPKRPMIFVNVNLLGGRPFRSMRRGAGQPRTEPARRDREYHRRRSRGGPCARDHGRQSAMDGKRIRSLADRRQPVWLAKEPPRTRWPAARSHERIC